jgi:hypothetical protein
MASDAQSIFWSEHIWSVEEKQGVEVGGDGGKQEVEKSQARG